MRHGFIGICCAIVAVAPAIGQPMRPLQRSMPESVVTETTTAKWSSNYVFTPDTALIGHSAVYDPATRVMTVFGGDDWGAEFTYTNAVLLYGPAIGNGAFTTLIPNGAAGAPPARALQSAVYDRSSNRMIVFGGTPQSGAPFNDVWVLSNANGQGGTAVWTQLSPSGTPPAPRYSHTGVYDPKSNRMTIFGGYNGNHLSDVWVLSHANGLGGTPAWTQLAPSGTPPTAVVYATAVFDPNNDIMIVFGGENNTFTACSNGVWSLSYANGLNGSPQWTNLVADGAAGSPAQRAEQSAAYDVTNNRMMIFGGGEFSKFALSSSLNDVWVLANANGLGGLPGWTELKPTGRLPGPRAAQTAVYDPSLNKLIMFAGQNAEAVYYTVWVLSDANGL